MEGIVVKSTGSWYIVQTRDKEKYNCKIKGSFRIKDLKATNPIVVGDKVIFEFLEGQGIGLITDILRRKNYIIRKATRLSKQYHIIAANIDQAVLIVTLVLPRTSTGFIDRFLVTAEAYHIPTIIVFNKIDLYDNELMALAYELSEMYENIGYKCMAISALLNKNLESLKKEMDNKINLFAGHSGVGKSTIINIFEPQLNLKVQEVSKAHYKGVHATTFGEMFPLSFGGYVIDTPGIKEFGIVDFNKQELSHYFPEMREHINNCRYNNCIHLNEPDCAVQEALRKGEIKQSRYYSYLSMLETEFESRERRL